MTDVLLEAPLSPSSDLGPHRVADYLALPDDPRCELLYGRLYVSPSPVALHQVAVLVLCKILDDLAGRSGGLALPAPMDVHLAEHSVVQPDLLYVAAANRGRVGDHVRGAPDLVVEVVSPATARRDRGEKLRLYAQSGVREYWLVDPAARHIEFLVNQRGRFVVALPEDDAYASPIVDDLRLDLAAFWATVEARLA